MSLQPLFPLSIWCQRQEARPYLAESQLIPFVLELPAGKTSSKKVQKLLNHHPRVVLGSFTSWESQSRFSLFSTQGKVFWLSGALFPKHTTAWTCQINGHLIPSVSNLVSVLSHCLFLAQGLYDQALEDCEKALQLNEGNYKALYRKAKSLKELGRNQEAYEAVAKCSLAVPQVGCSIHTPSNYQDWHGKKSHSNHLFHCLAFSFLSLKFQFDEQLSHTFHHMTCSFV